MKINDNFLVGSDPEVFLIDTNTRELVSSIGIVGGTKDEPLAMDRFGFFCQEDNVLAEFNIPPAQNKEEFITNISRGLTLLEDRLPDGIGISISPYGFFKANQLRSKAAKEFGCDPDFNCWTNEENKKPKSKNKLLRTAGGHISVGYDNPEYKTSIELVKWMDALIGVPSTLMSDEAPRRELYGQMGAFRAKDFGVEYRTVSNFWLKSVERIEWAYRQTALAIQLVNDGVKRTVRDNDAIEAAINYGVEGAAKYLVAKYKIEIVNV
jgi:hypothetical protein